MQSYSEVRVLFRAEDTHTTSFREAVHCISCHFFWSQVVRAVFKSLAFLTESFSFNSTDVSRRLRDIGSVRVLFLVSFIPAVAAVKESEKWKNEAKGGIHNLNEWQAQ